MAAQDQPVPDDERDSAIGDDGAESETDSLTEAETTFPYEHGRRYHAYCDGEYLYPNDEREQARLHFQHIIFFYLLGQRLYLAPVRAPGNVLDLGTGTGIWAIDFADTHPDSMVLGVDLSPIQPTWVPPNCSFELFNYEHSWPFRRQFDFIHARMLATSITSADQLFKQAINSLTPGAWFEIQDTLLPRSDDDSIPPNSHYSKWLDDYRIALQAAGRDPNIAEKYERSLRSAGFNNIQSFTFRLPQNTWPTDNYLKWLGGLNERNILHGLEGFSLRLFRRYLGQSQSQLEHLLEGVRKDVQNRRIHAYWPV